MAIQTDPWSGQYTCVVGELEGHINGPAVRADACQATGGILRRGVGVTFYGITEEQKNGKMGDMGRRDPNVTLRIKGVGHKENNKSKMIHEKKLGERTNTQGRFII